MSGKKLTSEFEKLRTIILSTIYMKCNSQSKSDS